MSHRWSRPCWGGAIFTRQNLGELLIVFCALLAPWLGVAGIPNYHLQVWGTENGLPQNAVASIAQTRDGYLWLATYGGLARFDGALFTVFDSGNTPELYASRITSLFEDAGGTLWIGHETGELTRYDKDEGFKRVELHATWNARKIYGIRSDERGDLWVINEEGLLLRVKDGRMLSPRRGNSGLLLCVATDLRGRLWISRNGVASSLKDGELVPEDFGQSPDELFVQGLCPSRDGKLWVVASQRVRKWNGKAWDEEWEGNPFEWDPLTSMLETGSGLLVAGTQSAGLFILSPGGGVLRFNHGNGFPNDWIRSLREDREGNLWIGTGGSGLAVLRASNFALINAPDQWQGRPVLSMSFEENGSLWVGTEGGGLYRLKKGEWTRFAGESGLQNLFVWSLSEDLSSRLWAGTWGGGLYYQNGDSFTRETGIDFPLPIPVLFHDHKGNLWAGTGQGLLRRADAGKFSWIGRRGVLDLADVRAVVEDRAGTIWFGMYGGGLGSYQDGALRQFRKADGLSSDFVGCLLPDEDGSLWIGTYGGGLNRLKNGSFAAINTSHGLPNGFIVGIQEDGGRNFWLSTQAGIIRVAKNELTGCAEGKTKEVRCVLYGKGDGLPTPECSAGLRPSRGKAPDGKLWFSTTKGLVTIDPENISTNRLPPPVVIEELRVDGKPRRQAGTGKPLQISSGTHTLEFYYTGLSFVAPEKVRFKYRLEGLNTEWVEAGTRRIANFSYIPPGDYAFHVIACNNDGVWNETGATLAFTLLPAFWQTWWFRALSGVMMVAAGGIVVWMDGRRRIRRKLQEMERRQAVENERSRIAKDIHDDLGASLTRITMLSQSAFADLENRSRVAADLDQIRGTARELTRSMGEVVWAIAPQHDTLESLVTYLEKFGQSFLEAAGIRCRLNLPLHLPHWPLTAEARHNTFLAFKEALHNAVKHASASEVRISLSLEAASFVLAIEDDGKGFSPAPAQPGRAARNGRCGHGLVNMRQRMEEIGGRCEIQSEPGQGTRVTFVVAVKELTPC
jgi:signal transduction histidine kinase/ligand-binding sensor domain-containing protein